MKRTSTTPSELPAFRGFPRPGQASSRLPSRRRLAGGRGRPRRPLSDEEVYIAALRRDPCAYCGKPVQHIDHIVPRVESGPDDWTNLTGACASCNSRKSTMSVLRFLGGYPPADGGSERWAGEFDGRI